MPEAIRAGLVGAGNLGCSLSKNLNKVTDAAVVAITEIDKETRQAAGKTLDVPKKHLYTDLEEMLESESLDAVIIATPHSLHYDQIVTCFETGLDVFCEKPLTVDLEHAKDLLERDRASENFIQVGYQRHSSPPYVRARKEIDSWDEPPGFINAEITQDWISSQDGAWRSNPELSGGGQLYDTGSHLLDAVLWCSQCRPTAVSAEMTFWEEDDAVDIQACLTIDFEDETVANVTVSGDTPYVTENIHFWSQDGGVYVEGTSWRDREVRMFEPNGDVFSPELYWESSGNKIEQFCECIRTREEPPATPLDAYYVTAVTEAAYEAAEAGERVEIELQD